LFGALATAVKLVIITIIEGLATKEWIFAEDVAIKYLI
jgi:hypothetical protein